MSSESVNLAPELLPEAVNTYFQALAKKAPDTSIELAQGRLTNGIWDLQSVSLDEAKQVFALVKNLVPDHLSNKVDQIAHMTYYGAHQPYLLSVIHIPAGKSLVFETGAEAFYRIIPRKPHCRESLRSLLIQDKSIEASVQSTLELDDSVHYIGACQSLCIANETKEPLYGVRFGKPLTGDAWFRMFAQANPEFISIPDNLSD